MSPPRPDRPPLDDAIHAAIDHVGADEAIAAVDARLREPGPDACLEVLRAAHIDSKLARSVRDETEEAWLKRLLDSEGGRLRTARRGRGWSRRLTAVAATSIVACGLLACVAIYFASGPAAVVGRVTASSGGAVWLTDPAEAGDVVRRGDVFEIEQGFATVELGRDVVLDLVGPVRVRFDESLRVGLRRGLLAGRVGPAGHGFTVTTEDAEVVDLGTAFLVHKNYDTGTRVRVTEGEVQARLLGPSGGVEKVLDLVAGDGVRLDHLAGIADRFDGAADMTEMYAAVTAAKGRVRRFAGAAKPLSGPVVGLDFRAEAFLTAGQIYVIPEASGVTLTEDVALTGPAGPTILKAGTTVDSYLLHCDLGKVRAVETLGEGSFTFETDIAAVAATAAELAATDAFATAGSRFEPTASRGLEPGDDILRISPDGRTISFDWSVTESVAVDQARLLVLSGPQ